MAGTPPQEAPRFQLPEKFISSVEHPGVIVNPQNALRSLGGPRAIQETFIHGVEEKPLGFQTRPNDPYRRPNFAHEVATSNIVLKLSIPKRTGRRRKKGSTDPFICDNEPQKPAPISTRSLIRRLQDNRDKHSVAVIGSVAETFRFRALPDFQYSLMSSRMATDFQNKILVYNVEALKSFDMSQGKSQCSQTEDVIPPPVFCPTPFPHLYGYNQNPNVKKTLDADGRTVIINTQAVGKTGAPGVQYDVQQVPSQPNSSLPPIHTLSEGIQKCIRVMKEVLEKRPIFTRRAFVNTLGQDFNYDIRFSTPYCVYTFLSGPWRDTMIRMGFDPRNNPDSRQYQTLGIKLLGRADHSQGAIVPAWRQGRTETIGGVYPTSHIFDGEHIYRDGSTWQLCDITDPLLVNIINKFPPRRKCHQTTWGWMEMVPFCKVHVVMRDKTRILLEGRKPGDDDYSFIYDLPDDIADLREHLRTTKDLESKKRTMATNIRSMADDSGVTHRGAGRSQKTRRGTLKAYEAHNGAALGADVDNENENVE